MRVAVVGAGIMGASTAMALAERGHKVVVYDQYDPLHTRGSSHGRSRIIRKAYPDAFYTQIMDEAYGLWRELQTYCDQPMVFEPGLLYFGKFESETLRDVAAGLSEVGVPHDLLDHEQVARIFPRLRLTPGEIGILTPEAGWVDAQLAVQTSMARAKSLGAQFVQCKQVQVDRLALDFDRYVLCPGPWIRDFVPLPVTVSLQTFGYVEAGLVEGPVWIEDCENLFYGFPSEPGSSSFKIGVHECGPEVDPSSPDRVTTPGHEEAIRQQATARFGADKADIEFRGCLYTTSCNEDFFFGRHGEDGFFVSACSGHGFKFGPWMGRKLADFVEEKDCPEAHPRFCWPEPLMEA